MSDIKIITKIIGLRDIQKSLQQVETEINALSTKKEVVLYDFPNIN